MDIIESLEKIGLTPTESKVYVALLRVKEATAVKIAKEANLHRRTIYDNLQILARKGLVNQVQREGVNYFIATTPKSLELFLQEKEDILHSIMPQLLGTFKNEHEKQLVSVYVGVQGAKAIIEQILRCKGEVVWVGGGYFFGDALTYSQNFIESRFKKLNLRMVQAYSENVKSVTAFISKDKVRIVSQDFLSKCGYIVFGDKVAIGIIGESEITTIVIESKDAATAFRGYFSALWMIGKMV